MYITTSHGRLCIYNTIATLFFLSVCNAVHAVGDTVATSHKRGIPSSYVYIGGQC